MSKQEASKLAVFEGKRIRKILHEGEWWFSIIDVIEVLVGGDRPRKYWNDLKKKLSQEGYDQLSEKIGQLKMQSSDGKFYATDCANTETLFRLIQSIPSPKAEPFKRWLARVGKERLDEIENPELAEATTTKLHRDRDSNGMVPLKKDAQDGGAVAGRTRKDIEAQTDKPVISAENFKQLPARKAKTLKAIKD